MREGEVVPFDHLEIEALQACSDQLGIVDGILQLIEVRVGLIADHERDARWLAGLAGR